MKHTYVKACHTRKGHRRAHVRRFRRRSSVRMSVDVGQHHPKYAATLASPQMVAMMRKEEQKNPAFLHGQPELINDGDGNKVWASPPLTTFTLRELYKTPEGKLALRHEMIEAGEPQAAPPLELRGRRITDAETAHLMQYLSTRRSRRRMHR